jgi:hypothetical protein
VTETLESAAANYDEPWKAALEKFFEAFIAFFFPDAHAGIDWERGYEFLDKEFQRIVPDAEIGKRFVDKLVKVFLVDGSEAWLLLHIEIQSQTDADFPKRMFVYHYRIFDRYGREVLSFAVLGDDQPNWRPSEYRYGRWGSEMCLRFPIAKLLDYAWEDLEASDNPFAALVMAHRRTQETTGDAQGRLRQKSALIKRTFQFLRERSYGDQAILELFRLLDQLMTLPEPLELVFRDDIRQFEEENQMEYVTSVERIGRQEGQQEKATKLIKSLLTSRFGILDDALSSVVEPLVQLPDDEVAGLLLTCSREELLERFRQNTMH